MSTRSLLPSSLLDSAWLRLSARHGSCVHVRSRSLSTRKMHALATVPPPSFQPPTKPNQAISDPRGRRRKRSPTSLTVRRPGSLVSNAMVELERRVGALADAAVVEAEMKDEGIPEFTESELLAFYEDVLALPEDNIAAPKPSLLSQLEKDTAAVDALSLTLIPAAGDSTSAESSPLLAVLQARGSLSSGSYFPSTSANTHSQSASGLKALLPHQKVIHRLRQVVPQILHARRYDATIPIVLLTRDEFESLIRVCLRHNDLDSAEVLLALAKRLGNVDVTEQMVEVMAVLAKNGDVLRTEQLMRDLLDGPPTPRQRHLHIKAHEMSVARGELPSDALAVLHNYEAQNLAAPMATYTRLIRALFAVPSSLAHAQAWDLFSHMRYVAHPIPDAFLYAQMIRACAPAIGPAEPERALDLFTEMTLDRGLAPTQAAYTAAILVCARAGSKTYVNEAFRLAKEMLDAHRDARGRSAFRPDVATFSALLEGAKRIGDLARARWILAEMVQEARQKEDGQSGVEIDEAAMVHVFHAYAAYRPPFKRAAAPLVKGRDVPLPVEQSESDPPTQDAKPQEAHVPIAESKGAGFKQLPPQSRSDVLREVQALFTRIVEATGPDPSPTLRPFRAVQLTPRLLNSYISVFYVHGKLETAAELFDTLFERHGVDRTARSYVEALERCAIARQGHDREIAGEFAERLWKDWARLEGTGKIGGTALSPRQIERAHAARIRVLALTNNAERALDHLKIFVARFPPMTLREPTLLPPMRSTRTVLVGTRPLVRLTSALDVPDDTVPPLLGWADLEILHHRLVAAGRADGVRYVKWVCKAYEGSLRIRRDRTMLPGGAGRRKVTIARS